MKNKKKRLSSYTKGQLWSYLFLLPWLLGSAFFFLIPFLQAMFYSFNEVTFETGRISYEFVGFTHFINAFRSDPVFVRNIVSSSTGMITNTVLIIFFSLFISLLLNTKFKGRTVVRAIFFLPVIIANGVIIDIMNSDTIARMLLSGNSTVMFNATEINSVLMQIGLPDKAADVFLTVINSIIGLSWKSGIQILLFLAGLQTVPKPLYEASDVEGATAWERFWFITFPMLMPVILLNVIFTITEEFVDYRNLTMRLIRDYARSLKLGYSSALALIYFVIVAAIIGVVYFLIKRKTVDIS